MTSQELCESMTEDESSKLRLLPYREPVPKPKKTKQELKRLRKVRRDRKKAASQ